MSHSNSPSSPDVDRRQLDERLRQLVDEILNHDGFGSLQVSAKWIKKDLKEVLVSCGKEYRYVIRVR